MTWSALQRRRRICSIGVVVSFILGLLGSRTHAQVLDLDDAPPLPEIPASVLDEIAERMVLDLPAVDLQTDTGIVRSATATLRRVIAELATRGRGSDPGDVVAALAAIRLSVAVEELDSRLTRLSSPGAYTGSPPLRLDEEARRRGLDRLTTFVRSGLNELRRRPTNTIAAFDDTLTLILAPITDAIEILERRSLVNRWPSVAEIITAGVTPLPRSFPPLPDRKGLEDLDRSLRESTDTKSRALHRRFREAAARCDTLDPEGLATGFVLTMLDELASHDTEESRRRAIEVLDTASRIGVDLDRIASSPARRDADPDALVTLLTSTCAIADDDRVVKLLDRQAAVTALIAAGSTLDLDSIDHDLRIAAQAVQRRHRRLVRATVTTLIRIGSDPTALGDPAAVAAIQSLEQSVTDFERIRTAEKLSVRLTAIRPGAAKEFRMRVRGWCGLLGKDSTQAEGAAAIDRVIRDLDRFMPFPGEEWLIAGGASVMERTGGLGQAMLDRATETRRQWADEVSNGELDGLARAELAMITRLGAVMAAVNSILGTDENAVARGLATCNLWGGWFVAPARLAWTARTLAPSIRVAVAAAAAGELPRLARDLERLEAAAPPALVVDWIAQEVGPILTSLEAGAIGLLAASALPPADVAWNAKHRERLARICRVLAEIDAARARDDSELADQLTVWIVSACDDLLDEVRAEQSGGRVTGSE
ncbi:MAG: hypothetical protein RLZZ461_1284 [Planctomycetota bacterium]|jgi:hypothetical protein